jgi:hypothetical protein
VDHRFVLQNEFELDPLSVSPRRIVCLDILLDPSLDTTRSERSFPCVILAPVGPAIRVSPLAREQTELHRSIAIDWPTPGSTNGTYRPSS